MSKLSLGMLSAFWPEGVFRYINVPLQTVTEACVHRPASTAPSAVALVSPEQTMSYGELSRRVREGAAALRERGVEGRRTAIALTAPMERVVWLLAALEAGALVAPAGMEGAELVIGGEALPGQERLLPEELAGDAQPPAGRPDLRAPRLALPAPGGEVLYGHRQLVAMALAWGAFFQLGPEATTALLVPPADWLGLATLLGALCRGAAVLLRWSGRGGGVTVDYLVLRWRDAGDADVAAWRGRVRLGALVGIEGPFQAWPRRRLARTLETPALTVLGRNDLGPYVASHPEWSLADAAGIVLCNADLHPLDPSDGHPLPVGWDLVEAAEIGVKSPAVPQGAQVVEDGWARTHLLAHIDPSGLYYLRRSLQL